ncbi:MAG: pyridoxamine 5'-phosphate oxidase family protein [Chloroflexota bacterium]
MGEVVGKELPPSALHFIRGGRIAIVATADRDGIPNTAPFSWLAALDSHTVRLGVNQDVTTLANIRQNGHVSITITAPELHITFKGTARVIRDNLPEAPIPTAVVEVAVEYVKDDAIMGRTTEGDERVRWTDRRRLLSDSTIIQALLKA